MNDSETDSLSFASFEEVHNKFKSKTETAVNKVHCNIERRINETGQLKL